MVHCPQLAIRKNEKLRALTRHSFKASTVYHVTSQSSPDEMWTVALKPSDPAVKAYAARDKREYPRPGWQEPGDIVDEWLELWGSGRFGKAHAQLPAVVGGEAAESYPSGDQAWEVWKFARGTRSTRSTRSRTIPSPTCCKPA